MSTSKFSQQGDTRPPAFNNNNTAQTNRHVSRGWSAVIIPSCVIIVPMLLFPTILLGVIFRYEVSRAEPLFDNLKGNDRGLDQDAYYVDMSATRILTIASWSSSIALSLVGFAMTLWTYAISSSLLYLSSAEHDAQLPTPFQFALIFKVVSGRMRPLWDIFTYTHGWRKKRSKLSPVVSAAATVLFIGVALSILIILADQWLHLTTESVIIPQVYSSESYSQSGKGLALSCIDQLDDTTEGGLPCTIETTALLDALTNASISYQTVNNLSSTNRAELVVVQDSPTYAILSDPSAATDLDYSTTTFGVSTTCKPIGQNCNLQLRLGDTATFDCSPIDFRGESLAEVGMNRYSLQFYENSDGTKNASDTSFVNPFYFALAVNIDSVDEYPDGPSYMWDDPNIIIPDHGLSTVLWCDVSVYDVAYSRVNGTIVKLSANPSNDTLGGMVLAPLAQRFEINKWKESLRLAAFTNDSQAMADQFALTVSQTGIGLISGQLSPRENYEEQVRLNIIAARVPMAPLYTLVILCLAYCLFGVFLAIVAFYMIRKPDVGELQTRLGIPALVAEAFERNRAGNRVDKVEELFKEWVGEQSQSIGVRRSEKGGLKFEAFEAL